MTPNNQPVKTSKWRSFFVWLLVVLGCLMTAGFIITSWTERVLLSTDNWVRIVSPLPKDDQVASAVSNYTVTGIFNSLDVDVKIHDALPERAAFLAPTLTNALQTQSENITKKFIQSDQFQGLWESANRLAHARLIETARNETESQTNRSVQVGNTKFSLNLANLRQYVVSQLQKSDLYGNFNDNEGQNQIVADIKLSLQNLKYFIRSTDSLYAILPYAIIMVFLLALAISRRRYSVLLGISAGVMIVTTLQIIGVKILRPEFINLVQNNLYRPAVGVVWDALIIPFNTMARNYFLAGLGLGLVILFFGPMPWAVNIRRKLKLNNITRASIFSHLANARQWTGKYKIYFWAAAGVVTLIYLAFANNINWQSALQTIMVAISFGATVELFSLSKRS